MCFMKSVTLSLEILFPSECRYGMLVIFRYNFDCGRQRARTSLVIIDISPGHGQINSAHNVDLMFLR